MPGTMMELSVEDLLMNLCVIHTNYMSTPLELYILQKCLYSTNIAFHSAIYHSAKNRIKTLIHTSLICTQNIYRSRTLRVTDFLITFL